MTYQEFLKRLHEGTFLDRFEAKDQSWLQLLQTHVIESWLREMELDDPHRFNALKLVVWQLLLERHLLHLDSRGDPAKLESFWHWICSSEDGETQSDPVRNIWESHKLTDVVQHSTPVEQEKAFCEVLWRVVEKLESLKSLRWAHVVVAKLAKDRDITQAVKPSVNVVFALKQHNAIPGLRSGLVVRFRLLAPTPDLAEVLIAKDVFEGSFLSVFRDIRAMIDRELRFMGHDIEFLGKAVLEGKSGTFAFLMSQWLAAWPTFDDQFGTLPPWVVISGELNNLTGEMTPVGGLSEKVKLLAEHGVRIFIVGSVPKVEEAPKGSFQRIDLRSHELLECVSFQGTKEDLGNELQARALIRKSDVSQLQGKQLASITPEQAKRLAKLNLFRFVEFKLKDDFIPPAYAHTILQQAIQKLPQRGYIHLIGEAGIGKTILVESMRPGFQMKVPSSVPSPIGPALGHIVFRGTAETPTKFIEQILDDALEHARLLEDEVTRAAFRTELDNLRRLILDSQSPLPIQQSIADVVSCVRIYLGSVDAVILAIDGLDELTLRDSADLTMRIYELLPAPEQLRLGCYVLLTSRPELRPQVQDAINKRKVDPSLFLHCELDLNDHGYQSIVVQYIQNKLGSAAVSHFPAILTKAKRRFIWVRLLVELLRLSKTNLAEFEVGKLPLPNVGEMLHQYIEKLAFRVGAIDQDLVGWIKPALLVIAAAYEPITHRHLKVWLADLAPAWNPDAQFRLDAVLTSLQPLLHEDRVGYPTGAAYSIAHREIRDWLEDNDHADWNGVLVCDGHQRIVKVGMRTGFTEKIESKESIERYYLLYLLAHVNEGGDVTNAKSLLELTSFGLAQLNWFELCLERLDFEEAIRLCNWKIASLENLSEAIGGADSAIATQSTLAKQCALAFIDRGQARARKGDFAGAINDYEQASAVRTKCTQSTYPEEPPDENQQTLIDDFIGIMGYRGTAKNGLMDFAGAHKECDTAIDQWSKLFQKDGGEEACIRDEPEMARYYAMVFVFRGVAKTGTGDFSGAIDDYGRAFKIIAELINCVNGIEAAIQIQPRLALD